MIKGWTTTKLIAAVSISALYVAISVPGYSLSLITGVPAFSGIINTLIQPVVLVLAVLILKEKGTILLVATLYGVLSLPLPSLGGAGFLPKVFIAFGSGLTTEMVYLMLLQYKKRIALITSAVIYPLSTAIIFILIGALFGIPGIEKSKDLLFSPILLIPYLITFGLLGMLGIKIYKKIENTSVVKRIQSN